MRRHNEAAVSPGPDQARTIQIELEGKPIAAREGEPVACAMLAADETVFSRSIKYHRPRGPYCMAGECSHCLMRVDGVPNVFTCRVPCAPGMRVERQNAYPSAKHDVFEAIDWMYPKGLDHHEMFAGVPVVEQVMAKVARHLAGLGLLPDEDAAQVPTATSRRVPVAIVGGGAAGLAAAEALASRGAPFELFERESFLGGRRAIGPETDLPALPTLPAGSVHLGQTAIGLYEDEGGRFLAVVSSGEAPRLQKIYAERFLLTMGGFSPVLPFENNDLPGIYSGAAAARLLRRNGLVPGERAVIVGEGPELASFVRLFEQVGSPVAGVVALTGAAPQGAGVPWMNGRPLKAHGRASVRGLTVELDDGQKKKLPCDAVVVVIAPSPSFALARQGGAEVGFSATHDGFVVRADGEGRTAAKDLFVAGDLTGGTTLREASEAGRRAAEAIAKERQS